MITETCSCGASITVPVIYRAVLSEWRSGHRHDVEPTVAAESGDAEPRPPMVDVKGSANTERASQWDFDKRPPVRLGFRPNGGD